MRPIFPMLPEFVLRRRQTKTAPIIRARNRPVFEVSGNFLSTLIRVSPVFDDLAMV